MRLQLISRKRPYFSFGDWLAIFNIFINNPVYKLERDLADKFGNKYGVMFKYGRVGLYGLFKVWNIENKEIILPGFTCKSVADMIVLSGNVLFLLTVKRIM